MHNIIHSLRHQGIKGHWKGKEIFIPATKAPFERHGVSYTEASFFEDLVEEGEIVIARPIGVPLPQWEEYVGNKAESSGKKKKHCGKRIRENTSTYREVNEENTSNGIPRLDENLITHELHISPQSKSVKQHARVFYHEIESQLKEEINKLLKVGFIKPIHYSTWLASVVPMKKKNETIRVCVDFKDLNKACLKDDFHFPNIDTLVDATTGHEMFSFMDGLSGYNQIWMAQKDVEKIAFKTLFGNFYYTVMPFGLKNASATYQRAMTAFFHDIMVDCMEDYVDDIVVKSKKAFNHFEDLKIVFERCRK
ncbi:Reverse transcriptase domain - like 10 [Theobroma cacao]|nr:Reverse transcriptase domain - like 10 [Theobroma cacao]